MAAIEWWNILEFALARSELDHLQRTACVMTTGAMRITPEKMLKMLLDLSQLGTMVAALAAAYGLAKPNQKTLNIGRSRIWNKTEKVIS